MSGHILNRNVKGEGVFQTRDLAGRYEPPAKRVSDLEILSQHNPPAIPAHEPARSGDPDEGTSIAVPSQANDLVSDAKAAVEKQTGAQEHATGIAPPAPTSGEGVTE